MTVKYSRLYLRTARRSGMNINVKCRNKELDDTIFFAHENIFPFLKNSPSRLLDGPAVVYVNIFVRSISKIDDVVMVSDLRQKNSKDLKIQVDFIATGTTKQSAIVSWTSKCPPCCKKSIFGTVLFLWYIYYWY